MEGGHWVLDATTAQILSTESFRGAFGDEETAPEQLEPPFTIVKKTETCRAENCYAVLALGA